MQWDTIHASGLNSNGYKKNIADMGGNFWEWTAELRTDNKPDHRIRRGGSCWDSGNTYSIAYRAPQAKGSTNADWSFRIVLYQ